MSQRFDRLRSGDNCIGGSGHWEVNLMRRRVYLVAFTAGHRQVDWWFGSPTCPGLQALCSSIQRYPTSRPAKTREAGLMPQRSPIPQGRGSR